MNYIQTLFTQAQQNSLREMLEKTLIAKKYTQCETT